MDQAVIASLERDDPRTDPCHRRRAVVDPGHLRQDRSGHGSPVHGRFDIHLLDMAHRRPRCDHGHADVHLRGSARNHGNRSCGATRPMGDRRVQDDRCCELRTGDGDPRDDRWSQWSHPGRTPEGRHVGDGIDRAVGARAHHARSGTRPRYRHDPAPQCRCGLDPARLGVRAGEHRPHPHSGERGPVPALRPRPPEYSA